MKRILLFILVCFSISLQANIKKSALPIQKWKTQNGMRVYYVYLEELPIVDLRLAFDAGTAREPRSKLGLAGLTNRLIDQGTQELNASQIADKYAELGTVLTGAYSKDYSYLGVRSLLDNYKESMNMFSNMLKKTSFPQDAFSREKQIQHAEIQHAKQNPGKLANNLVDSIIFEGHPYASPEEGNSQTLENITREDVQSFYKKYYSAKNGVLVIVGAAPMEMAKQSAEQISLSLSSSPKAKELPQVKKVKASLKHLAYPSVQTQIRIATTGIQRTNPDYFPLKVANYTLGGGVLVSRLSNEVREKEGLAYSVYSRFDSMRQKGMFVISLATKQPQSQKALQITKQVLKDYVENGPTENELKAAKQYLTGSFPIKLDSNKDIIGNLLGIAFYNLPDDYLDTYIDKINKVTLTEVRAVLKKYINPSKLVVVTVGKSIS